MWLSYNFHSSVSHLSRVASNHSPLLLQIKINRDYVKKTFKFQTFWTKQSDFLDVVKAAWDCSTSEIPLLKLQNKLKTVKAALKNWSKTTIGDIFENLKAEEENVIKLEEKLQNSFSDRDMSQLHKAKARMVLAMNNLTDFWRQV